MAAAAPALAFATKSASARNGLANDTMSPKPCAKTLSATSGVLRRLETTTGISTASLMRRVSATKAARGTAWAMVGIGASCQPMPLLIMSTPAASSSRANTKASSAGCALSTRSSTDKRNMITKSSPTSARVRCTTSKGRRMRFSDEPPHSSSRRLVRGARNSVSR